MTISNEDLNTITQQLGREPEGVQEIPIRGKDGRPVVIRVRSMVRGKPFPNLFWLTDPILKKEIDKVEATGLIKNLENEILKADDDFKNRLIQDHKNYIELRLKYMQEEEDLKDLRPEYLEALKTKGIGGLSDYSRVRCLHMHFAHYLVSGNSVGEWLENRFSLKEYL
ncbi:MAG: DUF501 domain-containing protein [Deltaproteobacteria bacterium]|nr:MAG: DUF501 domain-containing protein [Deltaproteobacteria bacterium]